MNDPMKHNYMKKFMQLQQQGKLPKVGLAQVDVYHDHWCAINRGGYCNCHPEFKLHKNPHLDPRRN
jgi:hypothetical protein